ncbi:PREDICTED: uncharacterized protein LOC106148768 [Chinchilla lanigera]|uniref:uncharacterized protein LOC106148768 n=1 Tax=Chinchilla lanigera TaxID=34839 RepID=UPI00069653CD|nr:PREDICTED: uncharacterized protein LOC106148768 [Chinchilla lanigera]
MARSHALLAWLNESSELLEAPENQSLSISTFTLLTNSSPQFLSRTRMNIKTALLKRPGQRLQQSPVGRRTNNKCQYYCMATYSSGPSHTGDSLDGSLTFSQQTHRSQATTSQLRSKFLKDSTTFGSIRSHRVRCLGVVPVHGSPAMVLQQVGSTMEEEKRKQYTVSL